jgi:transposase
MFNLAQLHGTMIPKYKDEAYMENLTKIFVGVDVSKDALDVYLHPLGKKMRVENTRKGLKHLEKVLSQHLVDKVVFEATGGYELLLKKALEKATITSWCVNPERVSHFRKAEGIQAKSDTSDARVLAIFAEQKQCPYQSHKPTENEEKIRSFSMRRGDLIQALVAEKARLKHPGSGTYESSIKRSVKFLEKEIERIDSVIAKTGSNIGGFKEKVAMLESIPGIGDITAKMLIATIPELGSIGNKQASALIGVAPYTRRSGTYKGKEFIRGGRPVPRRALYMATLVAVRFNEKIKKFYQHLIAAGKKPKVALIAAMRKLIVIINVMLRKGVAWNPAV